MVSTADEGAPRFNGSNWEALNRVVALALFTFAQDDDYAKNHLKQNTYIASQFEGPALDWAATTFANNLALFQGSRENFVIAVREAFGVHDGNITALLRAKLEALKWQNDVPVFFAEFDRLTTALSITSDETRIVLIESKLPASIKKIWAEQALSFSNYETLRERCGTMWALSQTGNNTGGRQKPRCGSCGKKGHVASDCRGAKN